MQQHGHSEPGATLVVDDRSHLSPSCQRLIAQSDTLIAQCRQLRAQCAVLAAHFDQQARAPLEHVERQRSSG